MRRHDPIAIPRAIGAVVLAALLAVAAGCFQAPVIVPQGLLYSSTRAPLTVNFDRTPSGRDRGRKVSSAHTSYFHDPILTGTDFAWDDASIARIAHEGGLKEIYFADYEAFQILGIYGRFTVNVYGE